MDISIIIPIYNSEKFIKTCLDSVLNQVFLGEIEVICVDDGSTDQTMKILSTYKHNENVIVLTQVNSGPGKARNKGFNVSRGKFIFFIDSDDYLTDRQTLQNLYDVSIRYQSDITMANLAYGDNYKPLERQNVKTYKPYNGKKFLLLEKDYMFSVNKLYKRSLLKESGLFLPELRTYEDCEFTPRVYSHAKTIVLIDHVTYHYRQHGDSITHQEISIDDVFKLISKVKEYNSKTKSWEVQVVLLNLIEILLFNKPKSLNIKRRNKMLAIHKIYLEYLKVKSLKNYVYSLLLWLKFPRGIEITKQLKMGINKHLKFIRCRGKEHTHDT